MATRALKALSCLLRLAFISIVGYRFIDLLQPSLFYLLASGPIFGVHLNFPTYTDTQAIKILQAFRY
jgi:hypothetical protein